MLFNIMNLRVKTAYTMKMLRKVKNTKIFVYVCKYNFFIELRHERLII